MRSRNASSRRLSGAAPPADPVMARVLGVPQSGEPGCRRGWAAWAGARSPPAPHASRPRSGRLVLRLCNVLSRLVGTSVLLVVFVSVRGFRGGRVGRRYAIRVSPPSERLGVRAAGDVPALRAGVPACAEAFGGLLLVVGDGEVFALGCRGCRVLSRVAAVVPRLGCGCSGVEGGFELLGVGPDAFGLCGEVMFGPAFVDVGQGVGFAGECGGAGAVRDPGREAVVVGEVQELVRG